MEEHQILGESDWDEQDLLTIDEAGERLEQEIAELDKAIEAADDSAVPVLRQRRDAIETIRASIAAGPTELARID
ncbi:hypothetical protein [Nocardioides sp. AE5]|uniref:hypothetical protein n=1 Tax=Nocardioides sp. AE5 TaxID=2962573 RepID=UPI0028829BEF|nr:hypothetical protein [Nocardioides sp. AE5]MDT0202705.1 hypothetical protein [Nocardioides sp. AE5]